jgi:hypothetical protein
MAFGKINPRVHSLFFNVNLSYNYEYLTPYRKRTLELSLHPMIYLAKSFHRSLSEYVRFLPKFRLIQPEIYVNFSWFDL